MSFHLGINGHSDFTTYNDILIVLLFLYIKGYFYNCIFKLILQCFFFHIIIDVHKIQPKEKKANSQLVSILRVAYLGEQHAQHVREQRAVQQQHEHARRVQRPLHVRRRVHLPARVVAEQRHYGRPRDHRRYA